MDRDMAEDYLATLDLPLLDQMYALRAFDELNSVDDLRLEYSKEIEWWLKSIAYAHYHGRGGV